jgi:hypothetical protein
MRRRERERERGREGERALAFPGEIALSCRPPDLDDANEGGFEAETCSGSEEGSYLRLINLRLINRRAMVARPQLSCMCHIDCLA